MRIKAQIYFIVIFLLINVLNLYSQKSKHLELGDNFMEIRQYEKAIEEFSKALENDDKDPYTYYKRGIAFLYANQFDGAISDFTQVLNLSKDDPDSYNNRGLAYSYKGDLNSAMKDFDKAIKLDPNFAQAYINRGSAYITLKDFDKAVKDFDKAIKLDTKNPELYIQRARLQYLKEDYKKSIKDYSTAIALGIGSSKIYYNRGNAYFKLEMYEEAIKDYTKALQLDPDELDALNNRSFTYKMLNKEKEAEADRALFESKRSAVFTPFEKLNFKQFFSKGNEISIELPDNWKVIEMPEEMSSKSEIIITPENIDYQTQGMNVGVTIGVIKNLSKQVPVQNEPDILDFWKGSMDKSNEDMFIYRVNWQRHMQFFAHATILNRSTIQATESHIQFGLYEYAIAWGDNLIYIYFQAPEEGFDYYDKIFEKSYKSLQVNNDKFDM